MVPLKSSGKDGFPALFYKKIWYIIGEDVTNYCLDVLNNRKDMRVINNTTIVLIPKVQNPDNMGQFHPISLCNVLLKILSKVVANRFRVALQGYINET